MKYIRLIAFVLAAIGVCATGALAQELKVGDMAPDFTLKASDGQTLSAPVTVTLTVNPVNDAPVAVNDSFAIDEDTALVIAAPEPTGPSQTAVALDRAQELAPKAGHLVDWRVTCHAARRLGRALCARARSARCTHDASSRPGAGVQRGG